MLTAAQRLAREGKLTASRVAPLMTGDKAKIMAVWRELCGDPSYEEENLDDVWAVQLGVATEQLNLDWYQRLRNPVTCRGEVVVHPDYNWAATTLDGFDAVLNIPIEVKHVSGFEKYEAVLARYMPQVHWQMQCLNVRKCAFSVIQGARQPYVDILEYDQAYGAELMSRAQKLMEHVWNMTPPVEMEPVEYTKPSRLREYDMAGNNHWASYAKDFLDHQSAAKLFKDAEAKLKEMTPNDGSLARGYGVVVRRDRALRLSVRADVSDDGPGPKH
jgi:hypothetical protein